MVTQRILNPRRYDTASNIYNILLLLGKNKATLPEVASRVTTAKDVAGYITDPMLKDIDL